MNPPERIRWTDSRVDDLANEVRALRDVPKGMGELAVEMRHVQQDTNACHTALRELRDDFQAYCEEQAQTHEAHRLERKSDRRWMIGTALTAAGLVIAAMAILVGHF